jgi:hypothetical protein
MQTLVDLALAYPWHGVATFSDLVACQLPAKTLSCPIITSGNPATTLLDHWDNGLFWGMDHPPSVEADFGQQVALVLDFLMKTSIQPKQGQDFALWHPAGPHSQPHLAALAALAKELVLVEARLEELCLSPQDLARVIQNHLDPDQSSDQQGQVNNLFGLGSGKRLQGPTLRLACAWLEAAGRIRDQNDIPPPGALTAEAMRQWLAQLVIASGIASGTAKQPPSPQALPELPQPGLLAPLSGQRPLILIIGHPQNPRDALWQDQALTSKLAISVDPHSHLSPPLPIEISLPQMPPQSSPTGNQTTLACPTPRAGAHQAYNQILALWDHNPTGKVALVGCGASLLQALASLLRQQGIAFSGGEPLLIGTLLTLIWEGARRGWTCHRLAQLGYHPLILRTHPLAGAMAAWLTTNDHQWLPREISRRLMDDICLVQLSRWIKAGFIAAPVPDGRHREPTGKLHVASKLCRPHWPRWLTRLLDAIEKKTSCLTGLLAAGLPEASKTILERWGQDLSGPLSPPLSQPLSQPSSKQSSQPSSPGAGPQQGLDQSQASSRAPSRFQWLQAHLKAAQALVPIDLWDDPRLQNLAHDFNQTLAQESMAQEPSKAVLAEHEASQPRPPLTGNDHTSGTPWPEDAYFAWIEAVIGSRTLPLRFEDPRLTVALPQDAIYLQADLILTQPQPPAKLVPWLALNVQQDLGLVAAPLQGQAGLFPETTPVICLDPHAQEEEGKDNSTMASTRPSSPITAYQKAPQRSLSPDLQLLMRPRVSIGDLQLWRRDPQEFLVQRIAKIQAPPSPSMIWGKAVHVWLEALIGAYPPTQGSDPCVMAQLAYQLAQEHLPHDGQFFLPRLDEISRQVAEQECLRRQNLGPYLSLCGLWGQLEVQTPRGPVTLVSQIDRVDLWDDGQIEIIDYKSGTLPAFVDLDRFSALQLPLQALMIHQASFARLANALKSSTPQVRSLWWWGIGRLSELKFKTYPRPLAPLLSLYQQNLPTWLEPFAQGTDPVA